VPTRDSDGVFVPDRARRRPGIYTYLAGEPNNWSRATVDHNLKTEDTSDTVAGPFDPASVMLYRFDSFFYKTDPSPCMPTTEGIDLSEGDKRGLRLLYPHTASELAGLAGRAEAALTALDGGGLESAAAPESPYHARAVALTSSMLEAVG
jgi:hypothetical protein